MSSAPRDFMQTAGPKVAGAGLNGLQKLLIGICLLFVLSWSSIATAQQPALDIPSTYESPEAWLITYGPGDLYWQRFGHNAIWIRDKTQGIDHTFNFGFFDFQQARFISRFIQGKMLYFAVAQPAEQEFEQYREEGRSIVAQKLVLSETAYENLKQYLLEQVQLENRDYLYDYYLNNCSTKVRDALDLALGGAIQKRFSPEISSLNFRDHTRRSTSGVFWYYLGLEAALGLPVDRQISRWDEMFLPAIISTSIAELAVDGVAVVEPAHRVFQPADVAKNGELENTWIPYVFASMAFIAFFLVISKLFGATMSSGIMLAWLAIAASGGLVLSGLWFFTDHSVASPNVNVLLLNPLFVLGLWPALRRFSAGLVFVGLLLAGLQGMLPGGQFNLDLWAFLAPINGLTAWWLWRNAGQDRLH